MSAADGVDRAFVEETLAGLVRINSVNPDVSPGGPGEREIAAYVAALLADRRIASEVIEPVPGRPSVLGRVPGTGGGPSLMLNAHYDTVGVEDMPDPFSAAVRDGRLYGRGAYDMKGALAACLGAADALVRSGAPLAGDVVVAAVADEEYASLGTAAVIEHARVDGAIVTEPTHLRVCRAHKGFAWLRVMTRGRAAHGSRFEDGIDANRHMGRVLVALGELADAVQARPVHALVGPPSMHTPVVRGGSGISTYADRCILDIERRMIPGETAEQVRREIQTVLDTLGRADPAFEASVDVTLVREPFEVDREARIVQCVDAVVTRATGTAPEHFGAAAWMDSALLAAAGIETVVFGPTGAGAHAAEEWVDVDSVVALSEMLVDAARAYCGTADTTS